MEQIAEQQITETPDQKRKRLQRERTKKSRDRKRELAEKNPSPEKRQQMIEQTWGRYLYQLSTEERKQLEYHVSDFRYIVMLCRVGSQGIRDGVAYGSDKEHGIEFYPDQFFAEVEAFAKGFPPSDGLESYKRFDFSAERRIEDEPFYFRTFGLGVDGVTTSRTSISCTASQSGTPLTEIF